MCVCVVKLLPVVITHTTDALEQVFFLKNNIYKQLLLGEGGGLHSCKGVIKGWRNASSEAVATGTYMKSCNVDRNGSENCLH